MILRQAEHEASQYPVITGLSTAAAALDPAMIWSRLESWTAHRWGLREVGWTVEGPGYFNPPLVPATITAAELWDGEAWQTVTLTEGPLGFELEPGVYKIIAEVGTLEAPPAAVSEAFRRLAEYVADDAGMAAGAHRQGVNLGNGLSFDLARSPDWIAQALHKSGASDLLRRYRKP